MQTPDRCDLYEDLGDTSPAAPLFQLDATHEEEFFDGDTQVETQVEVEAYSLPTRLAASARG